MRRTVGSTPFMDVRVILERRPPGAATATVLPLNVFLAPGIAPTAATAAEDANLQAVFTQVNQILAGSDMTLGDIAYYDLGDAAFNQIAMGEERQLLERSGIASRVRLNLFLVNQVWGGNLLGLSAAVDGAKKNGESYERGDQHLRARTARGECGDHRSRDLATTWASGTRSRATACSTPSATRRSVRCSVPTTPAPRPAAAC